MPEPLDFEALFTIAPNPYMVLDHELRYAAANDAYLAVIAIKREELIGRRLFDLFPNDPNDPNNVSAQILRRSLERVLATGQRDHIAYIPYRVPTNVGGTVEEQLRYWSATHCPLLDANGKVREVHGEGVVGEQPWLRPGEQFEYTSGAVIETHVGTMHGSYAWVADDGTAFDAPIPRFTLAMPRTLH